MHKQIFLNLSCPFYHYLKAFSANDRCERLNVSKNSYLANTWMAAIQRFSSSSFQKNRIINAFCKEEIVTIKRDWI